MSRHREITRRRFTSRAITGAALAGVCLQSRLASAQSALDSLKVALMLPLSGGLAQTGQACKRGADVANDVFADMRIPVRVEISAFDTESKADTARTQAEKAIDAGAHFLVGAVESSQTIAVAQVGERRGVPLVVNISSAPAITESGYRFVVRNCPTAPMILVQGLAMQKEIFRVSGVAPKTAVIVTANDIFGVAMIRGIKAIFAKLDMPYQIVDAISYDPAAHDLSSEVAKAKATEAELLMPICRLNAGRMLIQELVKQRWEPSVINTGGPATYERDFIRALGKYSEFLLAIEPWMNPKSTMTRSLERHHAARFPNEQFDLEAAFTFEAVLIAAQARVAAGTPKPEAMMEALHAIKLDEHVMVGDAIQFDAKGQNTSFEMAVLQNLNRRPTVVLPVETAEAALVYPQPGWSDHRRR